MFTSQWHMNRLGLVDFWYYTNEEFFFKDGHMLLRGSNGSGKSVTMQSFIPLLLDGNKSSERLDSFGTRSRKLENYLLEEDSDRESRIGYLYLEFKRENSDVYKTIGMGLYARKNKPLDSWYFVIEDNRRINTDIFLTDGKLAITKQVLKNIIQNQVIDSQKEYMRKVNEAIFGFSNSDEYKEVINLLLQLRSPKLSNSLKPTTINEILSNSLQTLSEDDLRPMTEAITYMDDIQDQLDSLRQSLTSAQAIQQVYKQYNTVVLKEKLDAYVIEEKKYDEINKQIKSEEEQIQRAKQEIIHLDAEIEQLIMKQKLYAEEKSSLLNDNVMQLATELERAIEDRNTLENDVQRKSLQEENKKNTAFDLELKVKKNKDDVDMIYAQLMQELKVMDEFVEEYHFSDHEILRKEIEGNLSIYNETNYTFVESSIQSEMGFLKKGLDEFQIIKEHETVGQRFIHEKEVLQNTLDTNETEIEELERCYLDITEEIIEKYVHINDQCKIMKLSSENCNEISKIIHAYRNEPEFFKVDSIVRHAFETEFTKMIEEEAKLKDKSMKDTSELNELTSQYISWEAKKEVEIEIDEATKKNRKALKEKDIQYIPLYSLLEFPENLSSFMQDEWEELLRKLGLLNSILVQDIYRNKCLEKNEGMSDSYLFTTKPVNEIETIVLDIHEGVLNIKSLALHLGVDIQHLAIHENWVDNSMTTITLSHDEKSVYVGAKKRAEYRRLMLEELNEKIKNKSEIIKKNQDNLEQLQSLKLELNKEYQAMPKKDDLEFAKQNIIEKETQRKYILKQFNEVKIEIKRIDEELTVRRLKIAEIATTLQLSPSLDVFSSRYDFFCDYKEELVKCKTIHRTYCFRNELYESLCLQKMDVDQDLSELINERITLENQLTYTSQIIQQKEELLDKAGYGNIKNRLEEINEEVKRENEILQSCQASRSENGALCKYKAENLLKLQETIDKQIKTKENIYDCYIQELRLGYCITIEEDIPPIKTVYQVINQSLQTTKRKDDCAFDLQNVFYKQRGSLQEYNLTLLSLFKDSEDTNRQRLDVSARYRGKNIKFTKLVTELEEDIKKQSILLEESDRELIENILVNNLSSKIRRLIMSSEAWVKSMNSYIQDMNTSSSLRLRLDWKSKKADTDEQLESSKLVKLLKSDVSLMKNEDLQQLSQHFRSKIEEARKQSEKEEISESFHQIMRNIMDYRNWFNFTIFFEKTGDKLKELTNNSFYALSGGEKAMSMYVPLFSAVAAKFKSANDDAPMLIALDEAFAGVDEKNIDNMFELISKFGFDYIMNSQVLWGDYRSVKALMIHELFRPENARYVTVISYEWDGNMKRIVNI